MQKFKKYNKKFYYINNMNNIEQLNYYKKYLKYKLKYFELKKSILLQDGGELWFHLNINAQIKKALDIIKQYQPTVLYTIKNTLNDIKNDFKHEKIIIDESLLATPINNEKIIDEIIDEIKKEN